MADSRTCQVTELQHPLHIVLFEPEIPPNTGNLIRLCANTGAGLHLVEPLGFSLDEKALRRAGLDYHESARVRRHPDLDSCLASLQEENTAARCFALSTRGQMPYHAPAYQPGDVLLFGPESRGLPTGVLTDPRISGILRIPMRSGSRSLNLSNAVSIITYEVLRQLDFPTLR